MLTKDQLNYSIREGRVRPGFLNRNSAWTEKIENLLQVYRANIGQNVESLNEELDALSVQDRNRKRFAGIRQVISKGIHFEQEERDWGSERSEVFSKNIEQLREGEWPSFEQSQWNIRMKDIQGGRLYGDLQQYQVIHELKEQDPEKIIGLYNTALLQGLLTTAATIRLSLPSLNSAQLRFLIPSMRFWGLVFKTVEQQKGVQFEIEGVSHLLKPRPMGSRAIAAFAGLLPHLQPFTLSAFLQLGPSRGGKLLLEPGKVYLRTRQKGFEDYIAEDHVEFSHKLQEEMKVLGYQAVDLDIPQMSLADVAVPDFLFRSLDGQKECSIELYQKGQKKMLEKRFQKDLSNSTIIGLEQSLVSEIKIPEQLNYFTYRTMPSIRKFLKVFKAMA